MSKKRTTISVDADVYEYLQQSEVNASGLIQELVREYETQNKRRVAGLELRLKHLENEIEATEAKLERKREEAEEVQELLKDARQTEKTKVEEVYEECRGIDYQSIDATNLAIQNHADNIGMEPEILLKQLRELDRTQ
jgi:predicted  nucleic acid-binding Zn-ribbon protein